MTQPNPTPMRFRIVPHTDRGDYHLIQYNRVDGPLNDQWETLIDPHMSMLDPYFWTWDHPMMFSSPEEAVTYAKTLDAAKVDAYLAQKRAEWGNKKVEAQAAAAARCKTIYL